jgi:hypothetical protein
MEKCYLAKMTHPDWSSKDEKYKIPSAIIEVDVADDCVYWEGEFPISKFMEMITFLLKWTHANLVEPS